MVTAPGDIVVMVILLAVNNTITYSAHIYSFLSVSEFSLRYNLRSVHSDCLDISQTANKINRSSKGRFFAFLSIDGERML